MKETTGKDRVVDPGNGPGKIGVAVGPVPIPYPDVQVLNTDSVKKLVSKKVKLKPGAQRPAPAPLPHAGVNRGVVSRTNLGKTHFQSWSMDVKVEGKNVTRHLDMTTHNHGVVHNIPLVGPGAKAVLTKIKAGGAGSNVKLLLPGAQTKTIDLSSAEVQNDPRERANAIMEARRASGGQINEAEIVVLKVKQ